MLRIYSARILLLYSRAFAFWVTTSYTYILCTASPYIANKLYGKINLKLVQLQRHLPTPPSAQIYGITFIWYNENDS